MYNDTHKDKYINVESKINEGIKLSLKYTKPETALNAYIRYIGEMMQADRVYIYEKDEFAQDVNTYEWISEELTSDKSEYYTFSSELCKDLYKKFENDECIVIYDINEIKDIYPELYDILKKNKNSKVAIFTH